MDQLYSPGGANVTRRITFFLGRSLNGILIGSAVLVDLTIMTDRPTDHATLSVTIGRIYVT